MGRDPSQDLATIHSCARPGCKAKAVDGAVAPRVAAGAAWMFGGCYRPHSTMGGARVATRAPWRRSPAIGHRRRCARQAEAVRRPQGRHGQQEGEAREASRRRAPAFAVASGAKRRFGLLVA